MNREAGGFVNRATMEVFDFFMLGHIIEMVMVDLPSIFVILSEHTIW